MVKTLTTIGLTKLKFSISFSIGLQSSQQENARISPLRYFLLKPLAGVQLETKKKVRL
jgi:hypothetical protein